MDTHTHTCLSYTGLAGLATDQDTFNEKLKFRIAMYGLREERDIKPASFGKLVSSLLYEKRFGPYFIEVSKENYVYRIRKCVENMLQITR